MTRCINAVAVFALSLGVCQEASYGQDFWEQLGNAIADEVEDSQHHQHHQQYNHQDHSGHANHNWTPNGTTHHEGYFIHNGHIDHIDHVHHNGHIDHIVTHDGGTVYNSYPSNYSGNVVPSNRVQYERVWNGTGWERVPVSSLSNVRVSSTPVAETVIQSSPVISSSPSSSIVTSNVQPSTSVAAKTNSLPYKGPGVNIELSEDVGGEVSYVIDGVEEATIRAGEKQTLSKKGKYEVRFSRGVSPDGKDFGQARYTIWEGSYNFHVTDKGWELMRLKESASSEPAATSSPSGLKTNSLPSKASKQSATTSTATSDTAR